MIISDPDDCPRFASLMSDGSKRGINIIYIVQPKPEGLAQAFIAKHGFNTPKPFAVGNFHYWKRIYW